MSELALGTSRSATAHGLPLDPQQIDHGLETIERNLWAQAQSIGDRLERDAIQWKSNATDRGEVLLFQIRGRGTPDHGCRLRTRDDPEHATFERMTVDDTDCY